jgi:hypothetical protein
MKARKSTRWTRWRRNAVAAVDLLVAENGESALPVRLSSIARARKVQDVVFRPLLVDGCLGVRRDGFVIFVRCEKRNSADLNKAWRSDDLAHRALSPRMRFTIAHEIAHTFFFNVETVPPRATVDLDTSRTVNSLEYTCNELAARILLPGPLFRSAIKRTSVLDPSALREVARRSGVSPQVLIVRLKQSFDWADEFGAALCVRQEETGLVVVCKAMHYSLRGILGTDRQKVRFDELLSDPGFLLNGGDREQLSSQFPCFVGRQRAVQEFVWRCENASPVLGSTYFVTVKRVGDLQLLNPVARDL